MNTLLILMFVGVGVVVANNGSGGSTSLPLRWAMATGNVVKEINTRTKDIDVKLDKEFNHLQAFIRYNNENIKTLILEELQPQNEKWTKIVQEECIINGQFSIDQLRVLQGLQNIKKIQEINTLMQNLDFSLLERFIATINKIEQLTG